MQHIFLALSFLVSSLAFGQGQLPRGQHDILKADSIVNKVGTGTPTMTYGANMNSAGITNAGAIAGATNVTATGTIQSDILRADTIRNEAGTGAPTLTYGASMNNAGITGAGAIAGATTIDASGGIAAQSFKTTTGTTSVPSNSATTIYTIPSGGRYEVVVWYNGVADDSLTAWATVFSPTGTTSRLVSNNTGACSLTTSGTSVRVTQLSGSTLTMAWSVTKL